MSLLVLLSLLTPLLAARVLQLPLDIYASPKYKVSFLNALPLPADTAARWLRDGLPGGELQFLDQPWTRDNQFTMGIANGDNRVHAESTRPSLEHMKLGPHLSYLCLIPPAVDHNPPSLEDDSDSDLTPIRSWSLLQPLSGSCLYHRQGWFTYSYCHNEQIRQFRELPHSHPHPPGGFKPEEDPDFEGYTLGRAPPALDSGADLTVAEQSAVAANLELAREAGSRYLVQRWSDGTYCEKAGRSREVEVQFHCSMTTTDTILFVKEAKTCSYVLVILTPRLCGEPGFRSPLDSREEAIVRCREIVDFNINNVPSDPVRFAEADQPYQFPIRKPVLPTSVLYKGDEKTGGSQPESKEDALAMIQRAIKALMLGHSEGEEPKLADRLPEEAMAYVPQDAIGEDVGVGIHDDLLDVLRAAGFDIPEEIISPKKGEKKTTDEEEGEDQIRHDL